MHKLSRTRISTHTSLYVYAGVVQIQSHCRSVTKDCSSARPSGKGEKLCQFCFPFLFSFCVSLSVYLTPFLFVTDCVFLFLISLFYFFSVFLSLVLSFYVFLLPISFYVFLLPIYLSLSHFLFLFSFFLFLPVLAFASFLFLSFSILHSQFH